MSRRRRGFTLIEMLVVVVVLGVLAAIGILKYGDVRNSAIAAQMAQEMRAVQFAAFNYFAEHEAWPAEIGPGAVPPELAPLLPGQLVGSFDRVEYMLDYDNFGAVGGGGDDGGSSPEVLIGISVTSTNPRLFAKFVRYLGQNSPFFLSGSKLTYMISGPGGIF